MNYNRKKKSINSKNDRFKKYFKKMFVQVLICMIIVISTLIAIKKSNKVRAFIKENVYESNFSFAYFADLYKKYAGSDFPFINKLFKEQAVFNEKLSYNKKEKYYDGVKLSVNENYLIPVMESGIVVFTGEKENYGNIVIIQTSDDIDYWYCNVTNLNVKLYDYIEKGDLLGETNGKELYLVFQKNGKYIDYNDYLK